MKDITQQQVLEKTRPFQKQFTERRFANKLRQVARIGKRPLEMALTLYYAFRDPATPAWCKTVIIGSLGYFISVIDAIPDLTPVLGYTDDIGVMLGALAVLGSNIRPEHLNKARDRVSELLG